MTSWFVKPNMTATALPNMEEQNRIAISETVKRERKRLFEFIKRKVANPDDAEDILQDVLYQFTKSYTLVEPIREAGNWLFKVAGNRIIDWYRKRKPERLEFVSVGGEEEGELVSHADLHFDANQIPDDLYTRSLFWNALYAALEQLPVEQKQVFILHEIDGKSFQEIGEITGAGLNTLLSRKRYAVLFLREKLQSFYDELINLKND